jgi:hypothetical protein
VKELMKEIRVLKKERKQSEKQVKNQIQEINSTHEVNMKDLIKQYEDKLSERDEENEILIQAANNEAEEKYQVLSKVILNL